MSHPAAGRVLSRPAWLGALRQLALFVAAAAILTWCITVGRRVGSPYPVEWQEGVVVSHGFRLLDGLPVYTRPSATFIPALYPPLGYVAQAGAMKLLGRGLPAARAVSVAATLLIALLMAAVIHRATRSSLAALVAVGLFFAAYSLCLSWYDEARVDMLFMLLALSSLALLARERLSAATVLNAAILAALAALTKQQGLVIAGAGFGHLVLRSWRRALLFAASVAAVLVPTALLLQHFSGGWFLPEIWAFLFRYPLRRDRTPQALAALGQLAVPLGLAAAWVGAGIWRRQSARLVSPWALALAGMVAAGFSSMVHPGGTVNHLIPIVVLAAIMGGFLLGELDRAGTRPRLLAGLLALALLPFAVWPWPRARPSPSTRAAQARVVEEIAALPGEVLVLEDSFYGWLAGKAMNPDGASLRHLSDIGLDLAPALVDGLSAHRYRAVVLSYRVETKWYRTASAKRLNRLINEHYAFSRSILPEDPEVEVLRVPRHIYLPRASAAIAAGG